MKGYKVVIGLVVLVLLILSLSGCAPKITIPQMEMEGSQWCYPRSDPQNTGYIDGMLSDSLKKIWYTQLNGMDPSCPTTFDKLVFTGLPNSRIIALDKENGAIKLNFWADAPIIMPPVFSPPYMAYIGSGMYNVTACFDVRSGQRIFANRSGDSKTAPIICGDTIIVFTMSGGVYALNALNGLLLWQVKLANPIHVQPAERNDTLFIAANDVLVEIYRGEVTLQTTLPFVPTGFVVLSDDKIAISSESGDIAVISSANGQPVWQAKLNAEALPPMVHAGKAIFADKAGNIKAFDLASGKELWKVNVGKNVLSPPIGVGEKVVVSTDDGDIYLIANADGKVISKTAIHEDVKRGLASDGKSLFVPSVYGRITCLR